MPVEIFNKETFEAALPVKKDGSGPAWSCVGLDKGEYVYLISVGDTKPAKILVRSSIDSTGWSRATGEDSIRCYVVDNDRNPLSGKANKYTTRLPGWQDRMMIIIRFLAEMAVKVGMCPVCDKQLTRLNKTKKPGPNKGRWFISCSACNNYFEWLTQKDNDDDVRKLPPCPGCAADTLKELTVTKESPNKGRKFISCSDKSCNYFQWVE